MQKLQMEPETNKTVILQSSRIHSAALQSKLCSQNQVRSQLWEKNTSGRDQKKLQRTFPRVSSLVVIAQRHITAPLLRRWHFIEEKSGEVSVKLHIWKAERETVPATGIWCSRVKMGILSSVLVQMRVRLPLYTCTYATAHTLIPLHLFFPLPDSYRGGGGSIPVRHADSRLSSRDLSAWPASPLWCEEGWQPGPLQGNSQATGAFWEETGFFQSASSQAARRAYEHNSFTF